MKDKILNRIEEEALKYAERKSSSSVFYETHVKDFAEGAKFGYNIKESVDENTQSLYQDIEKLIIAWSINEPTTAGSLSRDIIKLLSASKP